MNRGGGARWGLSLASSFCHSAQRCPGGSGQKAWPQALGGSGVGALEGPILLPPPPGERQARSLRSHKPEPGPGASGGRGTGVCLLPFPGPQSHTLGLAQAGASGSQAEL